MGLNYAIDELYASGWSALNTAGCEPDAEGRWFPNVERVTTTFAESGFGLSIRHVQLFGCYRAEWVTPTGEVVGGVVGQSPTEAAVFALSRFRRQRQSAELELASATA